MKKLIFLTATLAMYFTCMSFYTSPKENLVKRIPSKTESFGDNSFSNYSNLIALIPPAQAMAPAVTSASEKVVNVVADGLPPIYLVGQVGRSLLINNAGQNLKLIIKEIDLLSLDK